MKNIKNFDGLYFLPLGGSGEIGMNLNLYCYNNEWLMVDCGVTFTDEVGHDVIMPDPKFITDNKKHLKGLVLTHAHEDHIGAIPYIWEQFRCPLYATPFTAEVIRRKLIEVGLLNEVTLNVIQLEHKVTVGSFEVEYIGLTHSIPEPNALAIRTPKGTILHTGDWKFDPDPIVGEKSNLSRLKEIGDEGVLALVCDSTNVFEESQSASELQVQNSLIELISRQKKRVAVALFASNVARLKSCLVAAQKNNRKACLVGRSLWRMYEISKNLGYLDGLPPVLKENEGAKAPRHEILYLCTGSQGEERAALSRIAKRTHPRIRLESEDTVIFSSRVIPGNELEIFDLQNRLSRNNVHLIMDNNKNFTHVSGHPGRLELKEMYQLVRPQCLIPVHGEYRHMEEQAFLGRDCGIPQQIVPHNGGIIELTQEGPKHVSDVHSGRIALEGSRIVSLSSQHIQDRRYMMRTGAVALTLVIHKNGKVDEPFVSAVGITKDKQESDLLREHVFINLGESLRDLNDADILIDEKLKETCRRATRKATNFIFGIKPIVTTHVVRL